MQINWYYSVFFLLPFQAGGREAPAGILFGTSHRRR